MIYCLLPIADDCSSHRFELLLQASHYHAVVWISMTMISMTMISMTMISMTISR